MELELYIALKAEIESKLGNEIKQVALWNNQFEHSNGTDANGRDEYPFPYPCVFLEFSQANFSDLSQGVQAFDLMVTTHLGFQSLKTEDTDVLRLKQDLYKVVQRFRNGYFARLTRVSERQDYNHSNVQEYITEYLTRGKDFDTDIRPTISVTPSITITATTVTLSGLTS